MLNGDPAIEAIEQTDIQHILNNRVTIVPSGDKVQPDNI